MKTKDLGLCYAVNVTLLVCACIRAHAQLPPDFPQLSINLNGTPAPGYLFGSLNANGVPGVSNYFAILDNAGDPILLSKTNSLGELACNGLFVTTDGKKGQFVRFLSKDSSFNVVATNVAGNGYTADTHDFEVLPNGHALILIYDSQYMDMSKVVPGGNPAALVTGAVIQEVDADNNVVFQWRSFDHIPVTDSYQNLKNPDGYIHVNSVWFDDTDGSIILGCRNTSEVIKISRVTGEILWRMQGRHNEFAFTNGIPGNSDPAYFQVQHNARRLANGNITIFDNGYSDHSDPVYGFTRPYSRAVEYDIDEVSRTARLVWQFRHSPDIITYNGGSMERLPGGHSIITWGNDNNASPKPLMTEVDATGNPVCEVTPLQAGVTGNFTRLLWPPESTYVRVTLRELTPGSMYEFNEGSSNVTGVTMWVSSLDGDQYNSVTVTREPFAPVLPRFVSQAPRVLPVRVIVTASRVNSLSSQMSFDVSSFGLSDPTNTTVYYRQTPGQGLFVPLPTEYNWVTHQLQTTLSGTGEFILGFPDVAQVPYPPLLITPAAESTVNQTLPVSLFWTPKGFARYYQLQVAEDAAFTNLLVDESYLTESRYTLLSVDANTRYYWRVRTTNYGGTGDWSVGSFTTVPPFIQVTVPNGGEAWQRGLRRFIKWNANLAETVAIQLYQGGTLVRTITTNAPNIGAYAWQVDLTLAPGHDYSIRISSSTDAALSDDSDNAFSIIDAPVLDAASVTRRSDGQVQLGLTVPGATQATVLGSSNLSFWEELQAVPLTNGSAVFVDAAATNFPSRFYRLRVP